MPRKTDKKPQLQKFEDASRELECDEDEAAFDERLRQIVGGPTATGKDKNANRSED